MISSCAATPLPLRIVQCAPLPRFCAIRPPLLDPIPAGNAGGDPKDKVTDEPRGPSPPEMDLEPAG